MVRTVQAIAQLPATFVLHEGERSFGVRGYGGAIECHIDEQGDIRAIMRSGIIL